MGYIDRGDDGPPAQEGFADHFEWDGPRWLYYREGWKAPIPISHEEHDRVIRLYENCTLGVVGLGMAMGLALLFVPSPLIDRWPEPVRGVIAAVAVVLFMSLVWRGLERWIMRPYGRRTPAGGSRDRDLLKRRRLAGTSWNWFGWGVAVSALLCLVALYEPSGFGWVFAAVSLLAMLYEAYQKWRFGRLRKRSTFP